MAYELEYKKVHNTLIKRQNKNFFGYRKGETVSDLCEYNETDACYEVSMFLETFVQKFVIQCVEEETYWFEIKIIGKDQDDNEKEALVTFSHIPGLGGSLQKSILLTLMKKTQYSNIQVNDNNDPHEIMTVFTPIYCSITSNYKFKFWYTNNNLVGITDNDDVVQSYVNSNDYDTWNPKLANSGEIYNAMVDAISNNLNSISYDLYEEAAQPNRCVFHFGNNILNNTDIRRGVSAGYNVVLIPMKCKPDGSQAGVLMSIVNNNNYNQYSLYNWEKRPYKRDSYRWKPVSVFLSPIKIMYKESGNIITNNSLSFKDPEFSTAYSDYWCLFGISRSGLFDYTRSHAALRHEGDVILKKCWKNLNTYGVTDTTWTLWVASGLGYEDGSYGGYTYIRFAIGIQRQLTDAELNDGLVPHSGGSVSSYWLIGDDNSVIKITRHPLCLTVYTDVLPKPVIWANT